MPPGPLVRAVACTLLATALCLPGPAVAEDRAYRFELTPYLGYRLGGAFDELDGERTIDLVDSASQGLMLSGRVQENTQWEVLFGRQATEADPQDLALDGAAVDMDVDYLHFGGTYLFDGNDVRPFIALTLGATRLEPGQAGFGADNFFSASMGGGWQFNATGRLGVRLEARVFATFIDSGSEIFCRSDSAGGSCLILLEADALTQWEARAGLVFRF